MNEEEYGYCEYDEDFAVTPANGNTYKTDEQMSSGDILKEEFSGTIGSYATGDVQHGLKIIAAPTGTGKTYGLAKAIAECTDTIKKSQTLKHVVYITPLKKNLEGFAEELREQFRQQFPNNKELAEKKFNENVLRIPSVCEGAEKGINTATVRNFFETIPKNSDLRLAYKEFCDKVQEAQKLKDVHFEEVDKAKETAERNLRKEIMNYISDLEKKNALAELKKSKKWIGKLYPSVYTDERKIILMTDKKLLYMNYVMYGSKKKYFFLDSERFLKGALIFIDEFDSTKATLNNDTIEKSQRVTADFLRIFNRVVDAINPENLSKDVDDAAHNAHLNGTSTLYKRGREIQDEYLTKLSFKTNDSESNCEQTVFADGTLQCYGGANVKGRIPCQHLLVERRMEIQTNADDEKTELVQENNNIKAYELMHMFTQVTSFFHDLGWFVTDWADAYCKLVNIKEREKSLKNNTEYAKMTSEEALDSLYHILKINREQANVLFTDHGPLYKGNTDDLRYDTSYYNRGAQLFVFENSNSHYDSTEMNLTSIWETPEKIMLTIARTTLVVGLSATATFSSVLTNYDQVYLSENLGDSFYPITKELVEKLKKSLKSKWEKQRNEVKMYKIPYQTKFSKFNAKKYLKREGVSGEQALKVKETLRMVLTGTDKSKDEYRQIQYCNAFLTMKAYKEKNIVSLLYLGNALPKDRSSSWNRTVLRKLFEIAVGENRADELKVLSSQNFATDKEEIQKTLKTAGGKAFIMSTYQTLGAGQNLQYEYSQYEDVVNLTSNARTSKFKDIQAIYLAKPTWVITNLNDDSRLTLKDAAMCISQAEPLYQAGEISLQTKNAAMRDVFKTRANKEHYSGTWQKLRETESYAIAVNRTIWQAVGRLCRTNCKSRKMYFFIEQEAMDYLKRPDDLQIVSPEMEILLQETTANETTDKKKQKRIRRAEIRASKMAITSNQKIHRFLHNEWTAESMKTWEDMREFVLKHPTMTADEWRKNSWMQPYYAKVTEGEKNNSYLFWQEADYNKNYVCFRENVADIDEETKGEYKAVFYSDNLNFLKHPQRMSAESAHLTQAMRNPEIYEYFKKKGYATKFKKNEYVLTPAAFNNLYKGALGEVIISFILKKYAGLKLKAITDSEKFEMFDCELEDCPNVYIDFKNWGHSFLEENKYNHKKIEQKMDAIGAEKVFIINLFADYDTGLKSVEKPEKSDKKDKKINEVRCLLDKDSNIIEENIMKIIREVNEHR